MVGVGNNDDGRLRKKVARRIQELAEGGLSKRARSRIAKLSAGLPYSAVRAVLALSGQPAFTLRGSAVVRTLARTGACVVSAGSVSLRSYAARAAEAQTRRFVS